MERTFFSRCPDPDAIIFGDAATAAFTHARIELDRKINYDIALLVRAGIALSSISMQVILESGEQRLLVGETVVQRYMITPTVDGQPLEVLR